MPFISPSPFRVTNTPFFSRARFSGEKTAGQHNIKPTPDNDGERDKVIFEIKHLKVREARTDKGKPWHYTHVSPAVVVLPVHRKPDGEFYAQFILQQRPPMGGRITIECPAGRIEPGENTADAAVRELLEETGHVITTRELSAIASDVPTSPGITDEMKFYYLARCQGPVQNHQAIGDECLVDTLEVPLKRLSSPKAFEAWSHEMQAKGYLIDTSVQVLAPRTASLSITQPNRLKQILSVLLAPVTFLHKALNRSAQWILEQLKKPLASIIARREASSTSESSPPQSPPAV